MLLKVREQVSEYAKRSFVVVMFLISVMTLNAIGLCITHGLHTLGCTSRTANDVVMAIDLFDFMNTGGGFLGASTNYFGWRYAKATSNPSRPIWHKVLFWENPFYITRPPERWPYECGDIMNK